ETVLLDLLVDAIRVEMGVAELREAAEASVIRPGDRNRNRRNGRGKGDELRQGRAPPLRIFAQRLGEEKDGRESQRRPRDGSAAHGQAGEDGVLRIEGGVEV